MRRSDAIRCPLGLCDGSGTLFDVSGYQGGVEVDGPCECSAQPDAPVLPDSTTIEWTITATGNRQARLGEWIATLRHEAGERPWRFLVRRAGPATSEAAYMGAYSTEERATKGAEARLRAQVAKDAATRSGDYTPGAGGALTGPESALPECPCERYDVSARPPRCDPRFACRAPARPVDGRDMECGRGHRFAGSVEEHEQARGALAAAERRAPVTTTLWFPIDGTTSHAVSQVAAGDEECAGTGNCHGCLKWCSTCGDVAHVCDARRRHERCDEHHVPPTSQALRAERIVAERTIAEGKRLVREGSRDLEEVVDGENARRVYDRQMAEEDSLIFGGSRPVKVST